MSVRWMNMPANSFTIFRYFVPGVFLQLEDEFNIVVIVPGRHMEVNMKYRLPCCPPIVRKDIEPGRVEGIDERLGNDFGRENERWKLDFGDFEKRGSMSFRNHQNMA